MDKEIALAVNFAKAPADLQKAATDHAAITKKIAKAKEQLLAKQNELTDLDNQRSASQEKLRGLIAAWDPNTVTP